MQWAVRWSTPALMDTTSKGRRLLSAQTASPGGEDRWSAKVRHESAAFTKGSSLLGFNILAELFLALVE